MSSVVFEELDGRKRRLTLTGGGLPLQGAGWGGEQTIETVWNPGSPVAVQHVFGPTEMPSDWEGEWNTTRLIRQPCLWDDGSGAEQELVLASDLRGAMDSLRFSGQALRVTWVQDQTRKIGRYGRITKFETKVIRADDMTWTLTLEWFGRDGQLAVPVVQSDQGAAAARAMALAATDAAGRIESAAFITANPKIQGSANTFTLGQLEQLADAPRALAASFAQSMRGVVGRVNDLLGVIEKVRDVPFEVTQQLADVAVEAVGTTNRFTDTMGRESYESWNLNNTFAGLLQSASYYGSATTGADLVNGYAITVARQAQNRKTAANRAGDSSFSLMGAGDLLDVVLPRQGDTMTSISSRYFPGEDFSYELARANGLPGDTITPPLGRPLIISSRRVLEGFRSR